MRIISIDPGYERLGIAVIEKDKKAPFAPSSAKGYGRAQQGYGGPREQLLFSECFKTKATLPFEERILSVGREVTRVIDEYRPRALAIENLFIATNQKTAMRVAEVRGAIIYQAQLSGLAVYEYTPLQIKTAATGYGKATKEQVMSMVRKLIAGAEKITQDDEMDAIAIGLTHFAYVIHR